MNREQKILQIGQKIKAKKNFYGENNKLEITKNKWYEIVKEPEYYNFPIVVLDDDGIEHHLATSIFH